MTLTKKLAAFLVGISTIFIAAQTNAQNIVPVKENHRTYLINGLASAMPFIGYGFNNLKGKLGHGKHYAYLTPVEGRIAIQPAVLAEIKREYRKDPTIEINLVGISYGANIVTALAAQLDRANIPVNYLAVLDGPVLVPVTKNVHRVDNFVCRTIGCMGQRVRLAGGNKNTLHTEFTYRTSHVGLGDDNRVHQRIEGQLTSYALYVAGPPVQNPGIDPVSTASVTR